MNTTNYKQISITIILAGLMLLLAGCFRYTGVMVRVVNNTTDYRTACSGSLQATFQAGNLTIQSPKVEPEQMFFKPKGSLPSGIGTGTLVTVEAWCYDADTSKPTGYIRVEERWRYDSVNSVSIYSPVQGDMSGCVRGVEERAPVPCVYSSMLSD